MALSFGEKIKSARKLKKLTQKQLAKEIGAAHNSVSDWENDISRPEYEKLIELAKLYEINLYDLLGVPYEDRFQD